jgi:predicted secreted protein
VKKVADERSGNIVFVSHCLLNQSARFPGIAVQPGPVAELVRGLVEAGVGIEQLPCPEMKYWGGINRKVAFLPLPGPALFLLLPPLKRVYAYLCAREAHKTAGMIGNLQNSGYRVLGMVAMNDSPTCGLDRTVRLTPSLLQLARTATDLSSVLPALLVEGSGYFMRALRKEIEALGAGVPFFPFDPWGNAEAEADKVMRGILAPTRTHFGAWTPNQETRRLHHP